MAGREDGGGVMDIDIEELKRLAMLAGESHSTLDIRWNNFLAATDPQTVLALIADVERLRAENAELKRNYQTDVRNTVLRERERVEAANRVKEVLVERENYHEALRIERAYHSSEGVVVIVKDGK
jgi:hypothetical protein